MLLNNLNFTCNIICVFFFDAESAYAQNQPLMHMAYVLDFTSIYYTSKSNMIWFNRVRGAIISISRAIDNSRRVI